MGVYNAIIDDEAVGFLAELSNGDARTALNAVELGVLTTDPSEDGKIHITLQVAEQCIQKEPLDMTKVEITLRYYFCIYKKYARFDPDAAVYYLAKMLYAGESVDFIARRIMICAAEDVGLANPQALVVAHLRLMQFTEWVCLKRRLFYQKLLFTWQLLQKAMRHAMQFLVPCLLLRIQQQRRCQLI